jgi:Nucleoside-diphosphate-sugar epimerases
MKISRTLVLGGRGLVGSAIVRELNQQGIEVLAPSRSELNLLDQKMVNDYFSDKRPNMVYLAAAKVGGIKANDSYRADFIFENLQIQNNVFGAAFHSKVEKLLFLGSSCIYPKFAEQPIREESLLTGPLEPTNEPYAIAKIAGLKLAESFRRQYGRNFFSAMPTNLYGVNDNFDPQNSHVIPGLIRRMYEAKLNGDSSFEVWGTGTPRREFLYVDDLARACVLLMSKNPDDIPLWINIGTGEDISIYDLAHLIREVVGYQGQIIFNSSFPDGTPRKLLSVDKIRSMGWEPIVSLREGLQLTYESFLRTR